MNAQITLFMVIGTLFILSISLVLLHTAKIQSASPQKKLSPQVIVRPIIEYVTSCVEIAAKEALKTLGEQGGFIYQSQGGITPDPLPTAFGKDYVVADNKKIAYLIYPSQEDIGTLFFINPPAYPWERFPMIDSAASTIGYFGINNLPPLYNTSPNSIQAQLETAVAKNTKSCVDWTQFEAQGLHIKTGEAHADMLIASNITQLATEETITFTLHWPIEVQTAGTTATIDTFAVNLQLPFGKIYYAIKELIDHDVQDINYTLNSTPAYTLFVNNNIANNDDLIALQFNLQQTYNFQFARHNRIPALTRIKPETLESITWHAGVSFAVAGSELIISDPCPDSTAPSRVRLDSFDPDEDAVQYMLLPSPATFREPSGTRPPFELRVITTDGEHADHQTLRIKTTCCPDGCPT